MGLYAVPIGLIAYAVFGTSKTLIVGPVSTISVLTGSIVASRTFDNSSEVLKFVSLLTLVSGLVLLGAAVAQAGWVAELLSKPIITGFVFGLSLLINPERSSDSPWTKESAGQRHRETALTSQVTYGL